ncbi:hypothetical protein B0H14DRAFT_2594824 [Mycena olivaceomarginata]|nr:hypothetical protein B0H14DRAFT_2594824 [Mycena olivaceomarginata]
MTSALSALLPLSACLARGHLAHALMHRQSRARGQRQFCVHPKPVMFDSIKSKIARVKQNAALGHFDVLSNWVRHPMRDNEVLLALFCSWVKNPAVVSTTTTQEEGMILHAVIVGVIHPPTHAATRTIFFGDVNVLALDKNDPSLVSITRNQHLSKLFQEYERRHAHAPKARNEVSENLNSDTALGVGFTSTIFHVFLSLFDLKLKKVSGCARSI